MAGIRINATADLPISVQQYRDKAQECLNEIEGHGASHDLVYATAALAYAQMATSLATEGVFAATEQLNYTIQMRSMG